MALLSSTLLVGLLVETFSIAGADVMAVVGTVMDDSVMIDDGLIPFSGVDISSKAGVSVVNISVMLVLLTVSVLCQLEVVNSSYPLVWIIVLTFPGWEPVTTWDSATLAVGLVHKVKSTSSSPVMLLLSV